MKVAIIADDLTGANDTGVQFAKKGLRTSVLMHKGAKISSELDVLITDTDSRSQSKTEAYESVYAAASIIESDSFEIIYKKVDSTMRGNIGSELDAVYDVFQPDILVLAPGYPKNSRIVKDGKLYIGKVLLQETNFVRDLKKPMIDSYIPNILKSGTDREVALITMEDIVRGSEYVQEKIIKMKEAGIPYLLFDTCKDEDLEFIVSCVAQTKLNVVWAGSAGLADHLIEDTNKNTPNIALPRTEEMVLMVIGSVNERSRIQLEKILDSEEVVGIELQSQFAVKTDRLLQKEKVRVLDLIEQAVQKKLHIVLYSSGDPKAIELAIRCGRNNALTPQIVSNRISEVLGDITKTVVRKYKIKRLFLTGGDTAKRVCDSMEIAEFRLIDEVEVGVPLGMLVDKEEIITVTKAGGFGSEQVLLKSLKVLRGEQYSCVQ